MSIIPSSLICCNGTRLTCLKSSPEKGKTSIAVLLFITIIVIVTVIVHQHSQHTQSYNHYPSVHIVKPNEPTDLTDESLNYGVIFDCGSSGSRVYIYYWTPHSGRKGELLNIHQVVAADGKPLSKKITPGLSTYNKNTTNSAEYLRPLLDFASLHIPQQKHKLTPLYIMATAGMRLIDQKEAELIRTDIINDVPGWYDFIFNSHHVEIITGQWEGTYAWISLNYMLGRFSHSSEISGSIDVSSTQENTESGRQATVGVIDMGGGSMQIAYELNDKSILKDESLMTTINLACDRHDTEHTYHVYVTTFLGYGANSAFEKHKQKLIENTQENTISDPCFNRLYEESIQHNNNTYKLIGSGDVESCMNLIRPLLDKNECKIQPCSINGVHQPTINSQSQFYGISEYWYSFYDVLNYKEYYNKQKILSLAQEYCSTRWETVLSRSKQNLYPHADFERLKTECFKVSWVMEALHSGLNFPAEFQGLLPVNEINSQEVQWSLGALVYKTRNYPQTAIDVTNTERMLWSGEAFYITPYILALCIVVVLLCIYVYCRQLHRMNVLPTLKTVPSMKYFMIDEENQIGFSKEPQSYS